MWKQPWCSRSHNLKLCVHLNYGFPVRRRTRLHCRNPRPICAESSSRKVKTDAMILVTAVGFLVWRKNTLLFRDGNHRRMRSHAGKWRPPISDGAVAAAPGIAALWRRNVTRLAADKEGHLDKGSGCCMDRRDIFRKRQRFSHKRSSESDQVCIWYRRNGWRDEPGRVVGSSDCIISICNRRTQDDRIGSASRSHRHSRKSGAEQPGSELENQFGASGDYSSGQGFGKRSLRGSRGIRKAGMSDRQ